MAKYKKEHPEYTCIYGCINENTKEKTTSGRRKIILYDGQEIEFLTGYKLLTLIFEENTEKIIQFVKTKFF